MKEIKQDLTNIYMALNQLDIKSTQQNVNIISAIYQTLEKNIKKLDEKGE